MPDIATLMLMTIPIGVMRHIADLIRSIVLIRAQYLQCLVLIISDGVIAYQLVGHRNVQQFCGHAPPVMDFLIVKVSPMELELLQELVFTTGIGKIQRLFRRHSHEYLNHREDTLTEDTLVHITLQLEHSLRHIHARTFQLDMEQWHTINQQQHISTTVTCQRIRSLKSWLSYYLITTLPSTNLLRIVDLQINLLAHVVGILRIITFDTDVATINLLIDLVRRMPRINLINNLLHLRSRQRIVA